MIKKWRVILCGTGMALMLAACGSSEDGIQIVEQEDLADMSQAEKDEVSKEEGPEEVIPNGTELSEETGTDSESKNAGVLGGKPATVTIQTEEQEYKEGDTLVLTTSYDYVTVTIEGNETATQAVMAEFEKRERGFQESVAQSLEWTKENLEMIINTMNYSEEQGYEVIRNDGRILSFSSLSYAYEGGAHGFYMIYGLNFDAETGQILSIADITEDQDAFQKICVQEMLRQYGELKEQGIVFEEDMIPPSLQEVLEGKMEGEEWYFTEEGICFISNIYEIAPYAAGEILFDIPYEMINDVLKERYRG